MGDTADVRLTCSDPSVYPPSDDSFLLVDSLSASMNDLSQRRRKPPRRWDAGSLEASKHAIISALAAANDARQSGARPPRRTPVVMRLQEADPDLPPAPLFCVEVGCGSGYVIASLALLIGREAGIYLATDINPRAVETTRATCAAHGIGSLVDGVVTDMLHALGPPWDIGAIDVLLFNPPYVPTPEEDVATPHQCGGISASWAGGDRGRTVIDAFLPRLPALLSPRGCCFLVLVHENDPKEVAAILAAGGLVSKVALSRSADEEMLYVLKIEWAASVTKP